MYFFGWGIPSGYDFCKTCIKVRDYADTNIIILYIELFYINFLHFSFFSGVDLQQIRINEHLYLCNGENKQHNFHVRFCQPSMNIMFYYVNFLAISFLKTEMFKYLSPFIELHLSSFYLQFYNCHMFKQECRQTFCRDLIKIGIDLLKLRSKIIKSP